jgi:hypothetical protein
MWKIYAIISAIGGLVFLSILVSFIVELLGYDCFVERLFTSLGCDVICTMFVGVIAVFAFGIFWWLASGSYSKKGK